MSTAARSLRRLHVLDEAQIGGLADVLIDCVDGDASVSFMHPLTRDRAEAFWRGVARGVAAGRRALLVAEDARGLCGTVQLLLEQPENQPHRADLAKMLVHRRARRQGLGAALMRAAEATAHECGKTLLVLDTVSGGAAERLYARLGWVRVGVIPGYALMPRGGFCDTTVYYRNLGGEPGPTTETAMRVTAIEHVQLAMPPGEEQRARDFYSGVLGIPEVPKPPELARRGGAWFEHGALKIHLGVEADFRPARKAHPALLVEELARLVERLRASGHVVVDDDPLEGFFRVYVADPFGNRLELMEPL